MISYTEKELEKWFEIMEEKYQNCGTYENLRHVHALMLKDFFDNDNLKKVIDKSENV